MQAVVTVSNSTNGLSMTAVAPSVVAVGFLDSMKPGSRDSVEALVSVAVATLDSASVVAVRSLDSASVVAVRSLDSASVVTADSVAAGSVSGTMAAAAAVYSEQ